MLAYIGLGSNLDDPLHQVRTGIEAICAIFRTELIAQSSLYHSPPMGPQDQPDYINAVLAVETELTPHELLDALQQIEHKQGRIRNRYWGERTLDLDLLLYADQIIQDEYLTVPHPGITDRSFVIYPLAEIAPELYIPGVGSLSAVKANCPLGGLKVLGNKPS